MGTQNYNPTLGIAIQAHSHLRLHAVLLLPPTTDCYSFNSLCLNDFSQFSEQVTLINRINREKVEDADPKKRGPPGQA